MRDLSCELDYLSKPDGSAILSMGSSVALCAVYGPMEVKLQNMNIEKAFIDVLFQSKSGQTSVGHRLSESLLRQVIDSCILAELHPRTAITVTIQELEDHGGLMSCCVNATCLALINAGLSMKSFFAAVNCAVFENGDIILDPSDNEESASLGTITFIFDNIKKELLSCFTNAKLDKSAYSEALKKCRQESDKVFDFYRTIVSKYARTLS